MPTFILVAIGVLSVLGLILGYVLRRYLPQSRWIFALVIVITIMPWLLHHLALLRFAEQGLAGEAGNYGRISLAINLRDPGLVILITAAAIAVPNRLRLIAMVVPAVGFLVAWYVTLPLIYTVLRTPFDNMQIIWLFIWTAAATSFLLTFCWPQRQQWCVSA